MFYLAAADEGKTTKILKPKIWDGLLGNLQIQISFNLEKKY